MNKFQKSTLAILLTCYNRKEKTLSAVESVFGQEGLPAGIEIRVYLVDDGSSDGTSSAITEHYPQVRLIQGTGNLYCNGGMRLAFGEALKEGYDYYLWLNDDTDLFSGALVNLLNTSTQLGDKAIVVGSIQDPETSQLTYGGVRRLHRWWRPLKFTRVAPGEAPVAAETMNGNCVLIPQVVAQTVGNLDPAFTHGSGDFDYGLRARQLNFDVIVAKGYFGTCKRNDLRGNWMDPSLSLRTRFRKVLAPVGLPPREWAIFTRRYGGLLWPVYWAFAYRRVLFPWC